MSGLSEDDSITRVLREGAKRKAFARDQMFGGPKPLPGPCSPS